MAAAIVQEKGEAGAARGMLTRLGLSIFFSMNVMAFTMALWTTDVYGAAGPGNQLLAAMHGLFRHVVLLFSLPVLFLLGVPLLDSTWQNLRRGICLDRRLALPGSECRVRRLVRSRCCGAAVRSTSRSAA